MNVPAVAIIPRYVVIIKTGLLDDPSMQDPFKGNALGIDKTQQHPVATNIVLGNRTSFLVFERKDSNVQLETFTIVVLRFRNKDQVNDEEVNDIAVDEPI